MPENDSRERESKLNEILKNLQSDDDVTCLQAITALQSINYSSGSVRAQLEKLALNHANEDVRKAALNALDLPTIRYVASRLTSMPKHDRQAILNEIDKWKKNDLIGDAQTEVIKRRYDFDSAPPPAQPKPAPVQPAVSAPQPPPPTPQPKPIPAAPVTQSPPAVVTPPPPRPRPEPASPRPTLLQTLLSETSIKIYLYLGAFFVIASAVILGALVQAARLPILIIGTLIFGAAAVAIRKRLPQPSFALFIVFSFLLPITANVVADSLNLTAHFSAVYWMVVSLFMAAIWSGSTWLYESRLFSITAFISLSIAFLRIGDIFDAQPEFHTTMVGLAALGGLAGTWLLKRWKDSKFALPLFLTAQLLQAIILATSLFILFVRLFDTTAQALWSLESVATWGFAFVFFAFSDFLYPFLLFPWLAAGTLIPIPWFIAIAFKMDSLGVAVVASVWGLLLSAASEAAHRFTTTRKYSLPILLASIPTLAIAVIFGFTDSIALGVGISFGVALVYGILHILRPRGWLWAIALFNFVIAYYFFFHIPFMEKANVFFGFQLLGINLLFLLPDLFLKNDFKANLAWRLPPRMFGALFTLVAFAGFSFPQGEKSLNIAILFGAYAIFFALYAWKYQQPLIGYVSALALPISVLYALDHFNSKLWFEALTVISVLYYFAGFAMRKNEARKSWRTMFSISSLTLGSIASLFAFAMFKEHSGWFMAVIGILYVIEMYSRKLGLFEIGAHILLPAALYLILRDFRPDNFTYTLLGMGLIWLGLDLVFSRTFKEKRLLERAVKIAGTFAALSASLFLLGGNDSTKAAICFGIYTVFFAVYTAVQRKAVYGYIPAAYFPLTILFTLSHFKLDLWLPVLTGVTLLYAGIGFAVRSKEDWSLMLRNSALALGAILSFGALTTLKPTGGWYVGMIGLLFILEMYVRRQGLFEIGAHILLPSALYMVLHDFKLNDNTYLLFGMSLIWLALDLIFSQTFKEKRLLEWPVKIIGTFAALFTTSILIIGGDSEKAAICFGVYTIFFAAYAAIQRKAIYGYIPAAYLPLTIFFALDHFKLDLWLPALTTLAVLYAGAGYAILSKKDWSAMLRNSALALGTILAFGALVTLKETGGWYALVIGLLFAVEMYVSCDGWFEIGIPVMFNIGAFLILRDFKIKEFSYHLLAFSLVWLLTDLLAHLTFTSPRKVKWIVRGIGALLAILNYGYLFLNGDSRAAVICFGIYALLFLTVSLLYRQPNLLYTFTATLPLFIAFLFREFDMTKWIHPVIVVAAMYYAVGFYFRRTGRASGWDAPLLFSGLGLGLIVSAAAPILGGVDAAIPVAIAATLWAAEAFARKNAWLGFPANGLYLLAYFIILFELKVDQPQFFSMGAALLGLIQHYLLVRAGSKTGAFLMGMVSQLTLLGTTYIQMFNTVQLIYFVVLFFQSIVVLAYGIVIRSRSLTFMPIFMVVLGVVTVIYSTLKGINTVVLIGCTGIILLLFGILAVVMRERITKLGERLSSWQA